MRRLFLTLWYLLAAFVVLAALSLSVARLVLPLLETPNAQLETLVRDTVGADAKIGRLELAWRGLGPEVRVYDFALGVTEGAPWQPLLSARELRIGFDLLRSLWTQRAVPSRLVLLGSDIGLYRQADGHLAVEGIQMRTAHANPWLLVLAQPHVELRDIRVHWRDELGVFPDLTLTDIDLRLRNRGNRHQLQLNLHLPPEYGTTLQVAADLVGAVEQWETWRGAVYAAVAQAPLANWLNGRVPGGWQAQGTLDTQLWARIGGGRLEHLQGQLAVAGPQLAHAPQKAPLLNGALLSTQLDWRRSEHGWVIALEKLNWQSATGAWPQTGLTLAVTAPEQGARQVQLAVDALRIEPLLPVLRELPVFSDEQRARLDALKPGGELRGLQLAFALVPTAPAMPGVPAAADVDAAAQPAQRIADLRFRTEFIDIHNTAVDKLPGVSALSGRVIGAPERGVLELTSRDARITLPKLFRGPLQLDVLDGRIDWQRLPDRLRVQSAQLDVRNADIRTRSRLRLEIPTDGTRPLLDLQSDFADGLVEATHKYLPTGIMPPRTVEWLDRALVSGRIRSGAFLFQGRLGDFPFDHASGRMEVRANVGDAVLDYKDGWNRIEGLEAELAFVNRSMHIRGVAGQILGSEIHDVDVRIEDLAHGLLEIDGKANGTLADMLRFVQESPLGEGGFGMALGDVQAEGDATLQIGLRIPLSHSVRGSTQVDGKVALAGNRLGLPKWDFALEQLGGELGFTQDAFSSRGLRGRLLGVPVTLEVSSARLDNYQTTRVQARGKLPLVGKLRAQAGDLAKRFTGEGNWVLTLDLPRRAPQGVVPRLEVASDLKGVGVDLPAPFGKPAEEARDLRVRTDIRAGLGPFLVQYAGHSAALQWEQRNGVRRLTRGEVKFGAGDAQLPKDDGLRITGRLASFDWGAWRPLQSQQAPDGLLKELDVQIDELHAFARMFHALRIQATRKGGQWSATLTGPETEGTVELPATKDQPLRLRFAQLHIPPADANPNGDKVNPATLPALDMQAQKLRYRDLDLGQVTLTTHPVPTGMSVDTLQVNADWSRLAIQGEWTQPAPEQDASRFHIAVQDGDLGKLLAAFGHSGSVEGGAIKAEIDARWAGTPGDFALSKLEGRLAMRIGKGRLLNVEAGAGRMFGLFSLQALGRRLSLDFSDVFAKGFAFDRIEGNFALAAGDASTQDLVIEGPAARVEVTGRTGLVRHDYDQVVTVIPRVQSGLPIAGAIAGGPVVGAALLLADQLFSEQIEELTRFTQYKYKVTGSWDDPQYTPLPREPARGLQDKQQAPAPGPSKTAPPAPRQESPAQDNP